VSRETNLFGAFIDGRPPGERPRVAGVALRPFSAWHHFQLQALDSPFIRRGEVRRFELLQALAVCRLRYPDSCLRMPVLRTIWPLRRGIRHAVSEFLDYTGTYLYRPEYAVVERKRPGEAPSEQITNAPELMRLIGDIIGWAPWPEAYVWDLPLGRAYWYQAMSFRARGVTLSYMNDEEREFQEKMSEASLRKDEAAQAAKPEIP